VVSRPVMFIVGVAMLAYAASLLWPMELDTHDARRRSADLGSLNSSDSGSKRRF